MILMHLVVVAAVMAVVVAVVVGCSLLFLLLLGVASMMVQQHVERGAQGGHQVRLLACVVIMQGVDVSECTCVSVKQCRVLSVRGYMHPSNHTTTPPNTHRGIAYRGKELLAIRKAVLKSIPENGDPSHRNSISVLTEKGEEKAEENGESCVAVSSDSTGGMATLSVSWWCAGMGVVVKLEGGVEEEDEEEEAAEGKRHDVLLFGVLLGVLFGVLLGVIGSLTCSCTPFCVCSLLSPPAAALVSLPPNALARVVVWRSCGTQSVSSRRKSRVGLGRFSGRFRGPPSAA